ncbi:hypothetical protein CYY_006212 [Polysphondylium violaceum]|uniref:Uncharacterized protein n=1 Tax=Polysphondylium violaceum TaxID=133409 RepID=A0A8J4UYB7_9MYCE|nr:hypothetical protein CYY_006212 [Polysphondylium violaceum]
MNFINVLNTGKDFLVREKFRQLKLLYNNSSNSNSSNSNDKKQISYRDWIDIPIDKYQLLKKERLKRIDSNLLDEIFDYLLQIPYLQSTVHQWIMHIGVSEKRISLLKQYYPTFPLFSGHITFLDVFSLQYIIDTQKIKILLYKDLIRDHMFLNNKDYYRKCCNWSDIEFVIYLLANLDNNDDEEIDNSNTSNNNKQMIIEKEKEKKIKLFTWICNVSPSINYDLYIKENGNDKTEVSSCLFYNINVVVYKELPFFALDLNDFDLAFKSLELFQFVSTYYSEKLNIYISLNGHSITINQYDVLVKFIEYCKCFSDNYFGWQKDMVVYTTSDDIRILCLLQEQKLFYTGPNLCNPLENFEFLVKNNQDVLESCLFEVDDRQVHEIKLSWCKTFVGRLNNKVLRLAYDVAIQIGTLEYVKYFQTRVMNPSDVSEVMDSVYLALKHRQHAVLHHLTASPHAAIDFIEDEAIMTKAIETKNMAFVKQILENLEDPEILSHVINLSLSDIYTFMSKATSLAEKHLYVEILEYLKLKYIDHILDFHLESNCWHLMFLQDPAFYRKNVVSNDFQYFLNTIIKGENFSLVKYFIETMSLNELLPLLDAIEPLIPTLFSTPNSSVLKIPLYLKEIVSEFQFKKNINIIDKIDLQQLHFHKQKRIGHQI